MKNKEKIVVLVVVMLVTLIGAYCAQVYFSSSGRYGNLCNYKIDHVSKRIIIKSSFDTKIIYYSRKVTSPRGVTFKNCENEIVAEISLIRGLTITPSK